MIILKKSFGANDGSRQWLHVVSPTEIELNTLVNDYTLEKELLMDALDPDELARFELFDGGRLVIMRLPVFNSESKPMYSTATFGVFFVGDTMITLCNSKEPVIDEDGFRGPKIDYSSNLSFILSILLRSNFEYLHYLKDIKRHIDMMESSMLDAVSNQSIKNLLTFNKSLQYFDTSLRSNELLLEKLQKSRHWNWLEDETDLLQDVLIENREALENVRIYSNILQGLTGAFAIVINNNLNHMMTTLTTLTLLIMIPTGIASVYGMNIDLPLQDGRYSFILLMGGSFTFVMFLYFLFKRKKYI